MENHKRKCSPTNISHSINDVSHKKYRYGSEMYY